MSVSQKLGEKMYADMQAQQSAQAAAGGAQAGGAHAGGAEAGAASRPTDENVVDAEVKEVKKG